MLPGRKDARLNGQRIPLTKFLEYRATLVSENICKHERIDIQSHDRPRKLTAEPLGFQRELHCPQRILGCGGNLWSDGSVRFSSNENSTFISVVLRRSTRGRCPRRVIVRVK